MEPSIHCDMQWRAAVGRRDLQRPSRRDPRLQLEQASLVTEAQEVFGILVTWRLRACHARFR